MVYCGQPSKACAGCRVRRTKCDALRPSCSQCIRSGRQCTGYRDLSDMIFRDESKTLLAKRERKAEGKTGRPLSSPSAASRAAAAPSDLVSSLSRQKPTVTSAQNAFPSLPMLELGTSAEEQATCFFFRNYVLDNQQFNNGNFQYLSDIYSSEAIGPALGDCVAALGMVGLSNFWKSNNIMVKADTKYSSALRLVSSRLRDIEQAKTDQTLVAVMLLGLYETNTCNGPQSMKSWTRHINGAAALLHLRGKQQLANPISRHIFVHLRTQIITNCIQRHVAVPVSISEWSKSALQYETPLEATSTHLALLGIIFATIRSSMNTFHDYSNSANIVASLSALDSEYDNWASKLPREFEYRTIPTNNDQGCTEVFSDHYHGYGSIWIATVWNHYRCARILVNEILLDQLSYLLQSSGTFDTINPSAISLESDFSFDSTGVGSALADLSFYASLLFTATTTLQTLSSDICASVPFFLNNPPITTAAPNPSFTFSGPSSTPPKAVVGNLLLWPLYTAACTGCVPDEMRLWVANMLQSIAETMGIRQAAPLAESLRTTLDLDTLEWADACPTVDVDRLGMLCEGSGELDDEEGETLGVMFGEM